MQSFSGLATSPAGDTSGVNERVHYRHPIHSLVYVILDEGNGGIIRNLSQSGAAIQAVGALHEGQSLRMRFDLLNPKTRLEVRAVVSWANPSGQAGVRFVEMSRQSNRQINDWIFANLLKGLELASAAFPLSGDAEDLLLSASPRPPIRVGLAIPPSMGARSQSEISLAWWPAPIQSSGLAKFMDGLILFSASLMFFCAFLATARELPPWPLAVLVGLGVCGFFTALYWCLGSWLGCESLGVQLARIAMQEAVTKPREKRARFR